MRRRSLADSRHLRARATFHDDRLQRPPNVSIAQSLSFLPFLELVPADQAGVGGSIYTGAQGFFPLIVLVLLIVAGAQIMICGGGFAALQDWLLRSVATSVRRTEATMVLGTAIVNPAEVWPFVFHGWLLVAVFVVAAPTGFGREYTTDRHTREVARV